MMTTAIVGNAAHVAETTAARSLLKGIARVAIVLAKVTACQ
jgi:hypothetical protein